MEIRIEGEHRSFPKLICAAFARTWSVRVGDVCPACLPGVRPPSGDGSYSNLAEIGDEMDPYLEAAIDEAIQGRDEGGIPIGSVLVVDGEIVGRGHNRRVQNGSPVLHAEMDCFENAGRLTAKEYARSVLYSTLSPCDMCSGASLLYKIPKIVVGENKTFQGPENYVRERGVELVILDDVTCIELMEEFIAKHPELWNEDIGE